MILYYISFYSITGQYGPGSLGEPPMLFGADGAIRRGTASFQGGGATFGCWEGLLLGVYWRRKGLDLSGFMQGHAGL